MKLEEHQAIGYIHNDKAHKHVHLYVNRIDFNGKAFNSRFIGQRAQISAKYTAQKLGLTTVKEAQTKKLDETKEVRKEIKSIHDLVFTHKPKSVTDYISKMKAKGIVVKPVINKQKKLQGFRYEYKGYNFKGSEVHRDISINKLPLFKAQETSIPREPKVTREDYTAINQKNTLSLLSLFDYSDTEQSNNTKKKKHGKNRNRNSIVSR